MNITFTSVEVLSGILMLITLIICLIGSLRIAFNRKSLRRTMPSDKSESSVITNRTKHEKVNVFKYRGIFFQLSVCASLALATLCFSWTTYDKTQELRRYTIDPDELMEVEPPITNFPPPLPPPPPPEIIEIPDHDIIEEDQPELEDTYIDDNSPIVDPPAPTRKTPHKITITPPPPEDPVIEEIEEIIGFAEEMPRFPGCDNITDKKACSDRKLIEYLYKNLKYPVIARENGIVGRVFIQFVVEKDGSITDGKIVRDIGAGCGKAALKVVNNMNSLPQKWTPGKQRGIPVRVLYTLPVTFRLEN